MKEWLKQIPETERRFYTAAGFHQGMTLGRNAALIVVDVTYGFCGKPGATLEEAVQEFPTACGPASWEAMPRIARLIDLFRKENLPVVYTLSDENSTPYTGRPRNRSDPVRAAPASTISPMRSARAPLSGCCRRPRRADSSRRRWPPI
jgi:maleamate amidohydrolase